MSDAAEVEAGLALVSLVRQLWGNRQVILSGAVRELRWRYAGTAIGAAWHVIVPLAQALVYLIVFSALIGPPGAVRSRAGYAVFLCAGLFPWFVFSESIGRGSLSLLANEGYLKKLAVPESLFVAQSVATSGCTLAPYSVILLVLALGSGVPPRGAWLLALPVLALFLAFCLGLTLLLATLIVFYRDLVQPLTLGLQMWFWLTPIVYPASSLPSWLGGFVTWMPPSPYIVSFRSLLIDGANPGWGPWLWMVVLAIGSLALAASVLRAVRSDLRDAL
jgi:lipopolysaccharide transport system permease protein